MCRNGYVMLWSKYMRKGAALILAVTVCLTSLEAAVIPDWAKSGRVAGLSIQSSADDLTIQAGVIRLKNQNVSVIELDTSLSNYWTDPEFQVEVDFIKRVADEAHLHGMKVVVYYSALEVVTPDGEINPRSAAKDHPEWLQVGINGQSNVFYGSQEDWVPPMGESAWMSPNSGYKDYFIGRVNKLALETSVDGIWMDVPLYLDTGAPWSDMSPGAEAAFESWSQAEGHNNGSGFSLPTVENINDEGFRMWLEWRHINLANFIEEVRTQALISNPNWLFVTEVYPMDYLDTLWTGLDGARLAKSDQFIKVWEVDSVSNGKAMKYAHIEDMSNRIAMYKYARGVDRDVPSWGFTYGFEVPDAALGIGAAIATRTIPFETKTPIMTETVNGDMRTQWYGFIKDREEALFRTERLSRVGVWFSSATREYYDYANGGKYGMFLQETPPEPDSEWWAQFTGAGLKKLPHVSAWRGAAYGLHQLGISYKCVVDPTEATDLDGLEVLWLPSVVCLSDQKAADILNFVQSGGTVIATGVMPGTQDEFGNARSVSVLDALFGFGGSLTSGTRLMEYGDGAALYRPDVKGSDLFTLEGGNSSIAESTLGKLEQLLKIHTTEDIVADLPEGIFLELSEVTASDEQFIYALNYSGAQQPMQISPKVLNLQYRVPEGMEVSSIKLSAPEINQPDVDVPFAKTNLRYIGFEVTVEQFALIKVQLVPSTSTPMPNTADLVFSSPEIEEAVNSGLQFILQTMRNATGQTQAPYKFGVPTNLKDNNFSTTVYTGGHHVTAEHMGLLLRVTALAKDQVGFQEAVTFVEDVLLSKAYHVPGWSMDKTRLERFLQPDMLNNEDVWLTANAPLDDFRVVRGLLQGAERMGNTQAQNLAESILNGMYWTSVTDRKRGVASVFPQYSNGLIGYSWDWADQDVPGLTPLAVASGLGRLGTYPIPVDYQELETMGLAATMQPRWKRTLASSVDLLLDSEIPSAPGLFYNGLGENNVFTGDFEFPGERQGENLKVIQELWTILHLKRISNAPAYVLDLSRRQAAAAAADRGYQFFKNFYLQNGRVPEYLTFSGSDVPECGPTPSGNCLIRGTENLFFGEARIYAQLGRLALLMNDSSFNDQLVAEKIMTDRVSDPQDPRYGMIGLSTADTDDAEAWNTLEPLLTLCLASLPDPTGTGNNQNPVAVPDNVVSGVNATRKIAHTTLLANDTDMENQILAILSVDSTSLLGGTVSLSGTHVSYTPPTDFEGADSFQYTITDTEGATASSTVMVDVSSTVNIPLGITLDGDLSDWPQGHTIVTDSNDITAAGAMTDLLELRVHHQDGKIYFAYVSDGPIVVNWGYNLFIDADRNPSTGYQYYDIGADFVINDKTVQSYAGNGQDWTWGYVGDVSIMISGNIAEFSFPLNSLGNPDLLHLAFEGSNEPYNLPAEVDYIPDTITQPGPGLSYIVYQVSTSGSGGPGGGNGIVVDGSFDDWPASTVSFADPKESVAPADQIDLREIRFAADTDNFFFGYMNEYQINMNWGYQLLIDTDNNPGTGYAFYEFGADYILYDGGAFQYQGTGTDWNWSFIGTPAMGIQGSNLEMAVPKAWLGDPSLSSFRAIFVGDNEANLGTLVDTIPDGATIFGVEPSELLVEFSTTTPTNLPPVAMSDSASVDHGQAVLINVLLNDSDPDGTIDSSTLGIVTTPAVGTVTLAPQGTGIIYQHDGTTPGNYTFTYRVADNLGLMSSAATVSVSVNPPVNGAPHNPVAGRTIDGSLAEWSDVPAFGLDPQDATAPGDVLDWKSLHVAHNATDFFVAYETWQPAPINWGHNIYFDTDLSMTSGYRYGDMGADYLLQQGTLFMYIGDGYSWDWQFVTASNQASGGSAVEMSVPRASMGNPSLIRILFYGENVAYPGGTTLDVFPESGLSMDYSFVAAGQNMPPTAQPMQLATLKDNNLQIQLSATDPEGASLAYSILTQPGNESLSGTAPDLVYSPASGFTGADSFTWQASDGELTTGTITVTIDVLPQPSNGYPSYPISQYFIDGTLTEWAGVSSIGTDTADATISGQTSLDFRENWMGHSSDSLLIALRTETIAPVNWAYNLFLDTDINASTGYMNTSGGTALGADYLMQGRYLFQYSGTGTSWSWQFISAISHADSGLTHEWKVPLSQIGNPDKIHMVCNADNAAYSSGLPDDMMPEPGGAQGQTYFRYQVGASNPPVGQNKETISAFDIRRNQPFIVKLIPVIPVAQDRINRESQTQLKVLDLFLQGLPGDKWIMEYSSDLELWKSGGTVELNQFESFWAPSFLLIDKPTFFRARKPVDPNGSSE